MVLSYSNTDVISFLKGKFIVFMGDSNMRAIYKDLLIWIKKNKNITLKELRAKAEISFEGDKKLTDTKLTNGKNYEEIREYKDENIHIRFQFLTRCYSDKVENFMKSIYDKTTTVPDVIIMNSCLWDISRYGTNSVIEYQLNMAKLMALLKSTLPAESLFIWTTAPPISATSRGGFLPKNVKYDRSKLPSEVIKGNSYCVTLVEETGYNTLDLHYYLSAHIEKQQRDGIHYDPDAVRYMNNLILQRLTLLFGARSIGLEIANKLQENVLNTQECVQERRGDLSIKESYNNQKHHEIGWKAKIRQIQLEYENWSVEFNEKFKFMTNNSENFEEAQWKERVRKVQMEQTNWSQELSNKLKYVTDNSPKHEEISWVKEIALIQIKQQNWRREVDRKLKFMDDNRRKYNEALWKDDVRQLHLENENWSREMYKKLECLECNDQKYEEEAQWRKKVEQIRCEHENWSWELYKKLKCMTDDVENVEEVPWKDRIEKMQKEFQIWSNIWREKLRFIADDSSQNYEKEIWNEKVRQIQVDQENWSQELNRRLRLMRERKFDRYHPYSRGIPQRGSSRSPPKSLFRNNIPTYESEAYNYYSRRSRELNVSSVFDHLLDKPFRGSSSSNRERNADFMQFELMERGNQSVPNPMRGFSVDLRDSEFWVDSVGSSSGFDQCQVGTFWKDTIENNVDGFFVQRGNREYLTEGDSLDDFSDRVPDVHNFDTRDNIGRRCSRDPIKIDRFDLPREMNRRNESFGTEKNCLRTFGEDRRHGLFHRDNRMNRNPSLGPMRRSRNERYRYDRYQYRR